MSITPQLDTRNCASSSSYSLLSSRSSLSLLSSLISSSLLMCIIPQLDICASSSSSLGPGRLSAVWDKAELLHGSTLVSKTPPICEYVVYEWPPTNIQIAYFKLYFYGRQFCGNSLNFLSYTPYHKKYKEWIFLPNDFSQYEPV